MYNVGSRVQMRPGEGTSWVPDGTMGDIVTPNGYSPDSHAPILWDNGQAGLFHKGRILVLNLAPDKDIIDYYSMVSGEAT